MWKHTFPNWPWIPETTLQKIRGISGKKQEKNKDKNEWLIKQKLHRSHIYKPINNTETDHVSKFEVKRQSENYNKTKHQRRKKYKNKKTCNFSKENANFVINASTKLIDKPTKSLLNKGLKCIPTPPTTTNLEIAKMFKNMAQSMKAQYINSEKDGNKPYNPFNTYNKWPIRL